MQYRFGEFTLDTNREVLTGPDGLVALRRQTFRLLRTLLEHAPALVKRDQLIDQVWGHSALSPNVLPQAISELRQALGDNPQSPRYIETAHRRGYRLACSVERTMPDTENASPRDRAAAAPPRLRTLALAGAVLLMIISVWWLWPQQRPGSSDELTQTRDRTPVALGVFAHDAGVPGWVPSAALELMTQQLGSDERLLVLRRDGLGIHAEQTSVRWQHLMHDLLGAPLAVSGQWRSGSSGELRLDLNLIDLDSGRLLHGEQLTGRADALDTLLSRAVDGLRKALNLPAVAIPSGWRSLSAAQRQLYWEALAELNRGDPGDAAKKLATLFAEPQQHTWLAPQLARALRMSGRRGEAIVLLESISNRTELRRKLGDSLRVRAEIARLRHHPAEAAAALRALTALFPNEADLLLDLATAELDNLNRDAARHTVSRIETNPLLRGDPRLQLLQARLARLDGDLDRAEALAEAAAQSAAEHKLPIIAVNAHLALADTFKAGGDLKRAADVLEAAILEWGAGLSPHKLFELGLQRAGTLRTMGDMAGATELLAELDQIDVPDHVALQGHVELAMLHWDRGNFEAAETSLKAIEKDTSGSDDPDLTIAVESAWGLISAERNRPKEARQRFERAIALARATGRAHRVAGLQVNAGLALARQRRYAEADALWEGALPIFEQAGDRRGEALCLSNLAASASVQGLHERAFELNERALTTFRELGMNSQIARTSFNLGLLARRQGQFAQAEMLFIEAEENYAAGGNPSFAVAAGAHRVNLLTDAGRLDDAARVIQTLAQTLVTASLARQADLYAAEGRLKKWSGDSDGARRALATARHLRMEADQPVWVAVTEMQLLQLDLLTGADPAMVRVAAEDLLRAFTAHSEPRARAQALALIAETLIAQNRAQDARLRLSEARTALAEMPDINVDVALSWLDAWAADPAERILRLQALERRCDELGLQSRLAQIQTALGKAPVHRPGLLPPYVLPATPQTGDTDGRLSEAHSAG